MGAIKYYARFSYKDEGPDIFPIGIFFPDIPGCLSCANTREEAIEMAKDALECWFSDGTPPPPATNLDELQANFRTDEDCADEDSYEFVLIEI